jgi:fructan beta-fructosidase
MNDPNGLVYFEGEYHLFYQHHPESTVWGPMHWGHAVSTDLINWQHLPIALFPDALGTIFSGSAVVDWNNTSGFGANGKPPLVAMFTYHDAAQEAAGREDFQTQGLAYSNDHGRSWTKFAGNPVLPNTNSIKDFRDPKVSWHAATQSWVMALAARDRIQFWRAPDLKNWTLASEFGAGVGAHSGVWECPDIFELKIADSNEKRWVLLVSINPGGPNGGSATQYFVGDFDGNAFRESSETAGQTLWLDHGRDNYAGVTFCDIPALDGRRIFVGWMSNWDYAKEVPTAKWRSALTLPRTLALARTGSGLRVTSLPIRETERLRATTRTLQSQSVSSALTLASTHAHALEIELDLAWKNPLAHFAIELANTQGERYTLRFNAASNQFFSDRSQAGRNDFSTAFAPKHATAPRTRSEQSMKLRLLCDRASCELFADHGETTLTEIFFPSEDFVTASLVNFGGEPLLVRAGAVHALRPAQIE